MRPLLIILVFINSIFLRRLIFIIFIIFIIFVDFTPFDFYDFYNLLKKIELYSSNIRMDKSESTTLPQPQVPLTVLCSTCATYVGNFGSPYTVHAYCDKCRENR